MTTFHWTGPPPKDGYPYVDWYGMQYHLFITCSNVAVEAYGLHPEVTEVHYHYSEPTDYGEGPQQTIVLPVKDFE